MTAITVPGFLLHLPRQGGLPVPYVTGKDPNTHRYNFRLTDPGNHTLAHRYKLCGICGKYLAAAPYVFTVGPQCLAARLVFEAATHRQCALAAFELCPFLHREDWTRSEELRPGHAQLFALQELPAKPAIVGLASVPTYHAIRNPDNGFWYAELPREPFPIDWYQYRDGELTYTHSDVNDCTMGR